ncbi:MAG: HD domain-containing protein [Nitrospirae bacterium]|nr:HD domain-containing protein [Nitrospirota bacterium]
MNKALREHLLKLASEKISNEDPSHDLEHALRVLANAERIAEEENADLDIIIPAALFHDLINHPKNDPRAKHSSDESAEETRLLLEGIETYPKAKIKDVVYAIKTCSFPKRIVPDTLEAKILQDADGLEATGAISIMRTFSSTGSMKRLLYDKEDPFCERRQPESLQYGLDLFYSRLLVVKDRMHTKTGKKIAERRTWFLRAFLDELRLEIEGR